MESGCGFLEISLEVSKEALRDFLLRFRAVKPSHVIIGLGNPGTQYRATRHNIGFQAIDYLSKIFAEGEWSEKQKFHALVQEARIITVPILLMKPLTFMNRSGEAVKKIIDFYKLNPAEQLLVISDDVDLPLGEVRYREKGGPGTHNGLRSIVEQIGEGFPRIRIGLGTAPAGSDLATWVLSSLTNEELQALQKSYEKLPELLKIFFRNDDPMK